MFSYKLQMFFKLQHFIATIFAHNPLNIFLFTSVISVSFVLGIWHLMQGSATAMLSIRASRIIKVYEKGNTFNSIGTIRIKSWREIFYIYMYGDTFGKFIGMLSENYEDVSGNSSKAMASAHRGNGLHAKPAYQCTLEDLQQPASAI
jgi:hypothetical protein